MSDPVKHECGIAFIRLLKPGGYYLAKYGTALYGLNKLMLLMEKQHNRGQDGAGIACVKLNVPPGVRFINRYRSNTATPIIDVFRQAYGQVKNLSQQHSGLMNDPDLMNEIIDFSGELYLGHLRYGTFGKNTIEQCHPFIRNNNWKSRNIVLAGNFNLTNVDALFRKLVSYGQHPVETSDTVTVLEKIGHFVDKENERLYRHYREKGYGKQQISELIASEMDLASILRKSSKEWDGGYVMAGLLGHGDSFILRDPNGIRPCYYYCDDEIVVAASERPAIMTAFNVDLERLHELTPGSALIVRRNGEKGEHTLNDIKPRRACSFERIYFSRGTDAEIYRERKKLGKFLAPSILKQISHKIEDTVFSYIPNTASAAFYGLVEELSVWCDKVKEDQIMALGRKPEAAEIRKILSLHPRVEKIAVKDLKLRTFITEDHSRDDLVAHIYDVTYGIVDQTVKNLVVLDDSVVRGTTLRHSVIRMLDRLGPGQIIIASSAPQIRYPDCYGIDMARLGDFVAFRAAVELLHETGQQEVINRVYKKCLESLDAPEAALENHVKEIYAPFDTRVISEKISRLLTPPDVKALVHILFQSIEDLHLACPGNTGDWYFTGDYPTAGGNRVANRSFINYIEGKNGRAYTENPLGQGIPA